MKIPKFLDERPRLTFSLTFIWNFLRSKQKQTWTTISALAIVIVGEVGAEYITRKLDRTFEWGDASTPPTLKNCKSRLTEHSLRQDWIFTTECDVMQPPLKPQKSYQSEKKRMRSSNPPYCISYYVYQRPDGHMMAIC